MLTATADKSDEHQPESAAATPDTTARWLGGVGIALGAVGLALGLLARRRS
jgi:hypothetical protein